MAMAETAADHPLVKLRELLLPELKKVDTRYPVGHNHLESDIHIDFVNDDLIFKVYRFSTDKVQMFSLKREIRGRLHVLLEALNVPV